MDWIQEDVDAIDTNHRFSAIMFRLAQHNPEEALRRFRDVSAPRRRGELARNISKYIADADPDTAATWLENEVGGWFQMGAAAYAANELAEDDPIKGANFAIRFQNPRLLKRAVHEALKVFHSRDPQGMHSWAITVTAPTAQEAVQAEIERLSR